MKWEHVATLDVPDANETTLRFAEDDTMIAMIRRDAKSGDSMSDFLVDAELLLSASPLPPRPYGQLGVLTRETLCERFYTGESPSWEQDRRASQVALR